MRGMELFSGYLTNHPDVFYLRSVGAEFKDRANWGGEHF